MLTQRRQKEIASLSQRKYRRQLGQTIVEGVRALEGALAVGAPVVEVAVTHEAADAPRLRSLLADVRIPVHRVKRQVLERMSDVRASQGVVAVVEARHAPPAALLGHPRVLALDGVQDPGNVGTLIRSAAWFGVEAVLLGPGSADAFSPKVVRATMGALWEVALVQSDNLADSLDALLGSGFTIHAAEMGGTEANMWRPGTPSVLVLGSEGHGVSSDVLARAKASVAVGGAARRRSIDSLNVATAGAILMYQWTR